MITNYGLRITDYELRILDLSIRVPGNLYPDPETQSEELIWIDATGMLFWPS